MPTLVRRLPWAALALTVLTAAVLLLGPLWDDARGENPLERPPGVAWPLVLQLGLPTLMVTGALLVALALPDRLLTATGGLLLLGGAVLLAPPPLPVWFLPALLVTTAAVALVAWQGRPPGRGGSVARRTAAGARR